MEWDSPMNLETDQILGSINQDLGTNDKIHATYIV